MFNYIIENDYYWQADISELFITGKDLKDLNCSLNKCLFPDESLLANDSEMDEQLLSTKTDGLQNMVNTFTRSQVKATSKIMTSSKPSFMMSTVKHLYKNNVKEI